ncbi:MAG: hypothetical protein A2174_03590 [Candidatus Portnoybacteria bacterium RBG_13_41_18]|uniref:Thioredoxin domain-containing protein n=1 Tax=Candidatus Portnoybacteria bacterium RBG_13_41_18 TaxID=1801991 RepID=A0A1G2F870_9BACT|nr:MAG: hypothetical protein A2174_03590 [Candidatus Portnoybacteria bacterium RBG_13_41_18]
MEDYKKILIGLVVVALLLTVANLYWTFSINKKVDSVPSPAAIGSDLNNENDNAQEPKIVQVSIDDDPAEGSKDAPVTIIEFSDFQCPYCSKFVTGSGAAMPQIYEKYIKTGKVKLVFRDYPLPFHENAQKAAEAAQCAFEQGKFWEMHDKLFANQSALSVDNLKKYAQELGLDSAKFNSCLDSGKYTQETQKDLQDGATAGIGGTPSFFIAKSSPITVDANYVQTQSQDGQYIIKLEGDGSVVIGAQPFSVFEKIIEEELK